MAASNPQISVIMPVCNNAAYLAEAIESILLQTFSDWELIIILDPSQDNSRSIIEAYKDPRVITLMNKNKIGLPNSLNRGMEIARGEYIARMDADDISLPERLEKQIAFMKIHDEIGLCGTWIKYFGDKNLVLQFPADDPTIRCNFLFENNIAHPTVMMRRGVIMKNHLFYNPDFIEVEDYELWIRCSACLSFANLSEVLLLYRIHSQQAGKNDFARQHKFAGLIRLEEIKNLGVDITAEEFELHEAIILYQFLQDEAMLEKIRQWFIKIKTANDQTNYYSPIILANILNNRWLKICNFMRIKKPPAIES